MFVNGSDSCFITLKDHKPNFLNNPKVHLLNPAKNELGKSILDGVNTSLRNLIKVNQWKDTNEVIEWFKNIESKQIWLLKCCESRNFYYASCSCYMKFYLLYISYLCYMFYYIFIIYLYVHYILFNFIIISIFILFDFKFV